MRLPIIRKFHDTALADTLAQFPDTEFISHETREQFTADYPLHTRYFSNGDKPLVALVKHTGHVVLTYDSKDFVLQDGDFVFFDDNVPHSWIMRDCDIEVFYYRQTGTRHERVVVGDYCLDTFFHP